MVRRRPHWTAAMPFALRDPVSSLTHLATAVFGVYVTLLLWRLTAGDRAKRWSLACFGACMVTLYTASGLYHAVPLPGDSPTVTVFRRLDHSAIYLLIAGTYTPVFAVLLRGRRRGLLLAAVWLAAGAGIAAKWALPVNADPLAVGLYLGMGWLGVLVGAAIVRAVGPRAIAWGGAGGLFYTGGAVCELARWPVLVPGFFAWHEVFHLCDMAGTAAHVIFMVRYVVPYVPADPPPSRGRITDGEYDPLTRGGRPWRTRRPLPRPWSSRPS